MSCLLYLSVLPSYVDYLFCLLVLLLVRLHVLFTYMLSACAACLRNQPMNSAYATCLYWLPVLHPCLSCLPDMPYFPKWIFLVSYWQ
jgi:hypothetical protein